MQIANSTGTVKNQNVLTTGRTMHLSLFNSGYTCLSDFLLAPCSNHRPMSHRCSASTWHRQTGGWNLSSKKPHYALKCTSHQKVLRSIVKASGLSSAQHICMSSGSVLHTAGRAREGTLGELSWYLCLRLTRRPLPLLKLWSCWLLNRFAEHWAVSIVNWVHDTAQLT